MQDITTILKSWSTASADKRGEVISAMYAELKRCATAHLRQERYSELQPTELVNEAYLKLINLSAMDMHSRAHLLGIAATLMRQILVDQARRRSSQKRDNAMVTQLTGTLPGEILQVTNLLALNNVLDELAEIDPIYVQIVEARAFAGMTFAETAILLDVSESTIKRKWQVAQAWLREKRTQFGPTTAA